ncbi:hypothetical protein RJ640_026794 [Escallonia rubra]|uniref:Bifunctional inhibitor/plant lipid transfer protein/seed storage helical domain-containing protein n=1 Tax=Escallonia rubra TaxID=112253 RepID=A0AA88U367_9ASTE|nr:hypothetical protein RJ640_026794 [Escallonia rubra]
MSSPRVAVCIALLLLLGEARDSVSLTCNPTDLSACGSAITSAEPPSQRCCSKLKELNHCLCPYLKNPNLQKFVNSPNARKLISTCGIPIPKCQLEPS